jgi:uncharacterized membrane protein YraQ (UPF0718 family)
MINNSRQPFANQLSGEQKEDVSKNSGAMEQANRMPGAEAKTGSKGSLRGFIPLGGMVLVFVLINFLVPAQAVAVYSISLSYLQEMAFIIPPVFILMGLFEVWVPKTFIQKYMGHSAGIRGLALAFVFGTIPTGPLYIAFPLAAALLRKGARLMNVVIFLGIWAAAKLPQLMVEIKFLGPAFTALRLVLTVGSAICIGFLVEYFLHGKELKETSAKHVS